MSLVELIHKLKQKYHELGDVDIVFHDSAGEPHEYSNMILADESDEESVLIINLELK